jgi:hypothetical protein
MEQVGTAVIHMKGELLDSNLRQGVAIQTKVFHQFIQVNGKVVSTDSAHYL